MAGVTRFNLRRIMFALPTKAQVLTLLIIIALNQLAALAHACEITPSDWAEVEGEIENGN